MYTPQQSRFTVFGDAHVAEQHDTHGTAREAVKSTTASLWQWATAFVVLAVMIAGLTVLIHQLGHYGSPPIDPAVIDGFAISDPSRM